MAKTLLDKVGDLKTYHAFEDGKNHISYEQDDVSPLMDFAHALREEADVASTGKDFGYCAVRLPNTVVEELRIKHGINVLKKLTPTEERRLFQLIETDYRVFKLTHKKLYIPT